MDSRVQQLSGKQPYPPLAGQETKGEPADDLDWRPFPLSVLPAVVSQYVEMVARSIGCDMSLVVLPMLASLAVAVGRSFRIELKPGWHEPSIVWAVIIADSGQHKSPAIAAATRFVDEQDAREVQAYEEALATFKADRLRYETELRTWQRKPVGLPPTEPVVPVCQRLVMSDTTVEALAERHAENPRGLLVVRDEFAGWLDGMNQYKGGGRGSDTAAWLSIHSARPIRVDRRTGDRKTLLVPAATVSLCGGIQPPVLARCLGKEHFQDGMVARLLPAMPPKRPRKWTNRNTSSEIVEATRRMFGRLLLLKPVPDSENPDGPPKPVDLALKPEAQQMWIAWYNRHGKEMADLTGDLTAAWAKLEGYAARLALVIHLAGWAAGETAAPGLVDEKAIQAGITLVEWFKHETRRVYTVLSYTDEERQAKELLDLIVSKGGTISSRELMRASRRYRGSAKKAEAALTQLVNDGMGTWQTTPPNGGRPTIVFRLNRGGDGDKSTAISVRNPFVSPSPPERQGNLEDLNPFR